MTVDFNANKFEIARIIGARALQLSFGAPPLVQVECDLSPIGVAKKEFNADIIPLEVIVE
ncbi:DNA-directed RNA polymerase subunit K [Candidatus Micrarchaeota archaeon CG_4_10_14_0_2_um_filter_49_7]|nr:MAG: DNA-directed RNA polymerase subunit K [Candidatus Micrarchaeota archaeon CG06_land_8_20_14_3_00_50_6]PIZ98173.1 MAG: DNA-directed RNA polymerase subunit K [Candidatus Micrarchaeota archaeon CG_4_10_14_0_2_um_filter_49_7]